MKIHVEVDCTPEEARRLLGLPDVGKANDVYVDAMAKAMKGVGNVDQLQSMAKAMAPMGEIGMKLFQNFMAQNFMVSGAGAKPDNTKPDSTKPGSKLE